jgi:hypothetical protein
MSQQLSEPPSEIAKETTAREVKFSSRRSDGLRQFIAAALWNVDRSQFIEDRSWQNRFTTPTGRGPVSDSSVEIHRGIAFGESLCAMSFPISLGGDLKPAISCDTQVALPDGRRAPAKRRKAGGILPKMRSPQF